jgi:ADP-ribosyl-[dinitrogen reductase] hydrolase
VARVPFSIAAPCTLNQSAVVGSLLGTAVGDAMGLPYEGLSRRRGIRLLGPPDRYRLLPGYGMVSDDTEHACMTAQALMASGGHEDQFARELAWRMRLWLLALPPGVGAATARAIARLWAGFPPSRSGVFSAGNGPAMRSPIIGAAIGELAQLQILVRASTRMTHTDPKAEYAALAVALAAHLASSGSPVDPAQYAAVFGALIKDRTESEILGLVNGVVDSASRHESTASFATSLGLENGVSGYCYHTVPVVLHSWLVHQNDFRSAVVDVIQCGGDTDTTAALVGGIVGAAVGKAGIPEVWLRGLLEWPRTVAWIESLGAGLYAARQEQTAARPPRLPFYAILPRNLGFLSLVLIHGFRRLLPPY